MFERSVRPVQVFVIAAPMHCWGLERMIQSAHPRIELAGAAWTLGQGTEGAIQSKADVVLAEISHENELELLASLVQRSEAKVLVVTDSRDVTLMDKAVLAGARGVVKTHDSPAALLKAVEKVHEGEMWIDRTATSRIFIEMARQKAAEGNDPEKTRIATLTTRERQTIAAVAGDSKAPAKVIARRLCISEHTLRNHLTSIYSKLELTNRVDLYAFATRHHLTELR